MPHNRFVALDLLRGVAALAIVTRHFPWVGGTPIFLPRGYLAVDLFFMLSGFVLMHAYGERLAAGQTDRFYIERLLRLYPLYLLATLSAATMTFGLMLNGSIDATPVQWVGAVMTGLAFLPLPSFLSWTTDSPYVFVGPAWSLFWELVINLVFARLFLWMLPRRLAAMLIAGLVLLAVAALISGSLDIGAYWSNFTGGGARVFYSFFAGVAMCRLRAIWRLPFAVPDWLLTLLLLATFIPVATMPMGGLYDVAIVAIVFPMVIMAAAESRLTATIRPIGSFLGYCSYGVYVLQGPMLILLTVASPALTGHPLVWHGISGVAVFVALTLTAAYSATRWFDEPVRRWIYSMLSEAKPASVTTTSPALPQTLPAPRSQAPH